MREQCKNQATATWQREIDDVLSSGIYFSLGGTTIMFNAPKKSNLQIEITKRDK